MTVGIPLARVDGVAKVTGATRYAADHRADGMLHAAFVTAAVPAGRIDAVDPSGALDDPQVVRVLTAADLPPHGPAPLNSAGAHRPLQDDVVRHQGQPVAIVLAETLEAAEAAVPRVAVRITGEPHLAHPGPSADGAAMPEGRYVFGPVDIVRSDPEAGFAAAPVVHAATYVQPSRHHNPMEPSATLADWRDGTLTVVDAVQHVHGVQAVLAALLGLDPGQVRVRCPATGGAFGAKGFVWPHQVLAAAASMAVGRPVRAVLTRAQMYEMTGYQAQCVQAVRLAADAEGHLLAAEHDVVNVTSATEDWVEFATHATRAAYAVPALRCSQRVQRAHVGLPTAMRAPVEGPGMWALESAMNELADRLGIDPVELRLRNHADVDPESGRPWSSKALRACYTEGAAAFGWRSAPFADGPWQVGQGMATCLHGGAAYAPSTARILLRRDGTVTVSSAFQDVGGGILTVVAQLVAELLPVEPRRVRCAMGDTALPEAAPTYSSQTTMSVGGAVLAAARDVLARLELPTGVDWPGVAAALDRRGVVEIAGEGSYAPPTEQGAVMRTFGAIFVEVGVDVELGLVRLRRAVGRYSVGRVMNPRTARSQMLGGIVWGWGKAVLEASVHDAVLGRWRAPDLAGVALPVNADIPADIDVGFVDEVDPCSPIGGKGIGEVGATGVEAAVADAVFHATGRRLRSLPLSPDVLCVASNS